MKKEYMVFSFYNSKNIPDIVHQKQKEVFDHFNIPIEQIDMDVRHPQFMDYMMCRDVEKFIFMDIDAVPLRRSVIVDILNIVDDETLFGVSQQDNCNNLGHIYAAPSCIAFTKNLYEKLNKPSFVEGQRFYKNGKIYKNVEKYNVEDVRKFGGQLLCDVAEELTYRVEEKKLKLCLWKPTSSINNRWKVGNTFFGNGTTYVDVYHKPSIYHQFEIRNNKQIGVFVEKCDEITKNNYKND